MEEVELRTLATLVATVDEGSFGGAASRLGYAQSTISQHIAGLERAVGGRLFDRPGGPRRVRLTPLGEVVHAHAVELLSRADALHAAVERFHAGEGRLTIGTFASVSTTLLPLLIRRLRDEFPACDIRLSEHEADVPEPSTVDLLFCDVPVDGAGIESIKLFDDPYHLLAPRDRFPDGPVDLSALDGAPMVAWPPVCAQPELENALAAHGVRPHIVFHTAGNETVLSMVRAGLGLAILPRLAIHAAGASTGSGVSVHVLHPSINPREIYLVRHTDRTPSPLARRATEFTRGIVAGFRLTPDESSAAAPPPRYAPN